MSDTGLFSRIYQGIRDCADLLDRVLVRFEAGSRAPGDEERRRLAAWLVSLTDANTADSSTRMSSVLLRGQGAETRLDWAKLGEALAAGPANPAVIDRLEQFALALEREQAVALARLRGEA